MGGHRKVTLTKARLRSAISNGRYRLAKVDHRGPEMRRLKDLVTDHLSDLGGIDNASHAERLLVSRASMLALLAEMQEKGFILSRLMVKPEEVELYTRTVNTLRRTCQALGLQRRQKDITPDLKTYLATEYGIREEAVE